LKKTKLILGFILSLSFLALVGCSYFETGTENSTKDESIPVTVETVTKGSLKKQILLGGLLEPRSEVFISAKNPTSRILYKTVETGDLVQAGDTVIVMDGRDLDLQLEQARLAYERNLSLFEAGAVSSIALEQLKYNLDMLELQQENLILTTPISGIIAKAEAVEGQLAGSMPLVSVVDISSLRLTIQVGEANIAKIVAGQELEIAIPSVERKYKGRVISVAPQLDSVTKAYPVEIELVNEEGLIKGGMYAEVGLIVEQKNDVLRIPQNAVLKEGQDKIVFVAEADQAVLRKVETGLAIGDMVEIKAGLLGGESLIVEGQYAVREGSMLKVTPRGTAQ